MNVRDAVIAAATRDGMSPNDATAVFVRLAREPGYVCTPDIWERDVTSLSDHALATIQAHAAQAAVEIMDHGGGAHWARDLFKRRARPIR